jgi:hypothetical protein
MVLPAFREHQVVGEIDRRMFDSNCRVLEQNHVSVDGGLGDLIKVLIDVPSAFRQVEVAGD